jgi:hypothetical protein
LGIGILLGQLRNGNVQLLHPPFRSLQVFDGMIQFQSIGHRQLDGADPFSCSDRRKRLGRHLVLQVMATQHALDRLMARPT